jgi:periplasmic protein TonB
MSEPSAIAPPAFAGQGRAYELSSDLSRLCLPSEFKEPHRRLAWANSICFLFLVIGLVGLKAPRVVVKPLSKLEDVVPVVFTPPPEQPKVEPEVKQDEPPEPQDNPTEAPQVITVVAAADASAVAFAVPVQGAVAVAQARYATPPPPVDYKPPQPTKFDPNTATSGTYPPPNYPYAAMRDRSQGTVLVEIMVDASGTITSAKVQKSSGFSSLDDAALRVVKNRWRFPPGKAQWLLWPCQFVLQ